jgi:hypothetical protein
MRGIVAWDDKSPEVSASDFRGGEATLRDLLDKGYVVA